LELRASVAPRTTRVTALAAGTFGLLVVAALVLVVTPRNLGAPIAVEASTTLDDLARRDLARNDPAIAVPDVVSAAIGIGAQSSITSFSITTTTVAAILAALATPVGDGSYAVMTAKSLAGQSEGMVEFRLLSGDTITGPIMFEFDNATVVSIPTPQTPHVVATNQPLHSDTVTVMAETPMDMAFGEVAGVDVPEGTPIIDGEGALVGLCSKNDNGTTDVIEVDPSEIELPAATD